jgi:hypothetical protein
MSLFSRLASLLMVACLLSGAASLSMADVIIHDFQDGTFGPWNPAGAPVIAAVVPDSEPDFAGDRAGLVFDPDGGFQVAMTMTTGPALALLPALHANDTFEWEVDTSSYGGDFLGNHLVFQSGGSIGFNVLDGSFNFMAVTNDDQTYSHNYGAGEGRTILDTIDPDHDGDIFEHGFEFFNIHIIQQVADNQNSSVAYDNIRLTGEIPEPSCTLLLMTSGVAAVLQRRKRRLGQTATCECM